MEYVPTRHTETSFIQIGWLYNIRFSQSQMSLVLTDEYKCSHKISTGL